MNLRLKALRWSLALVGLVALMVVGLPVQTGQAAMNSSADAYGVSIREPYQSALLLNRVIRLPLVIDNTGSVTDQYGVTCSKESGGDGWSVGLLDSAGQTLAADCLTGAYYTLPVAAGGALELQLRLEAPEGAPIGDYLRVDVAAVSGNDGGQTASVMRQAAVSAPFVQNFSDNVIGRNLQVSNPKFFFTRSIGPRIEWPNSLAVAYINDFRYINAWGYGLGTHINIEYEVMNIRSGNPPSVVQLTDNPDRTADHSTALAAASNSITGVAFIRTVYEQGSSARQKQNVYFARIDARGLPQGTPDNVTENPYSGVSSEPNVPFFSGVSIRATQTNQFILTWAKLENNRQDIYEAVYDSVTGSEVIAPRAIVLSTESISFFGPVMAGRDTSAQTFLAYIGYEAANLTTPITLRGLILDNSGGPVGDSFLLEAINGSKIDTVQLWGGNILAAWIDDPSQKPVYMIWDTAGNVVKSPTTLDSPDGLVASQIALTYDQYGHAIITWGNQSYSRLYYALVDGSGDLITPPMIQRSAAPGSTHIDLGLSIYSSAFLTDPIDWLQYLPIVRR